MTILHAVWWFLKIHVASMLSSRKDNFNQIFNVFEANLQVLYQVKVLDSIQFMLKLYTAVDSSTVVVTFINITHNGV